MKSMNLFKNFIISTSLISSFAYSGFLNAETYNCDVVIVGGGAAGMHALYRLAPQLHDQVCLFEANDKFGGRVDDIESPNGTGKFGLGALRVQQGQNVMFNLAKELGIVFETAGPNTTGDFEVPYLANKVFVNGKGTNEGITFNVNTYLTSKPPLYDTPIPSPQFPDPKNGYPRDSKAYPNMATAGKCRGISNYGGCFNDAYYHSLLNPKYLPTAGQFNDNRDWIKNSIGPEGFQYLTDTFRFRGDFQNQVDPISYADFLREDWDICCNPTYPKGGMSQFIDKMYEKAQANSGRAFKSEGITSIGRSGDTYNLTTTKGNNVTAKSVIIAVPPYALNKINGSVAPGNIDIIAAVKNTEQFKQLQPIRVISINNWWKTNWWNFLKDPDGTRIDRAWSTKDALPNNTLYFNFIELPHTDYQQAQLVTRSVYNDDSVSSDKWAELYGAGGPQGELAINTEIVNELNAIFPELKDANKLGRPLSVDDISKTAYKDWRDAWYFLKGPTTLTNADIALWALQPLGPDEKVSLASDAYNPNRTTWVEGAIKSSINTLDYNYTNMNGHNARIKATGMAPLACNSVTINTSPPAYIPFNQNGVFNANCPLN